MPTLITGASGYIGSHLTKKLVDRGEKIRIYCRTKPMSPLFDHPAIELILGDINDYKRLRKAINGIDKIYHLAAYARLWAKEQTTYYKINVEGTNNILEAAFEEGVEKMVYTSTAGVLGPSVVEPINEEFPRTIPYFNSYEETKTQAENIVQEFAHKGLFVTTVNPARVYGPGLDCGSNPVTKIVELYLKGKWHLIPGTGNDIGSYCFIDDVVDGHIAAMDKGRSGERYILGGVNASFNELMHCIMLISGVKKRLYHLPFPILKAVSQVFKWWAEVTESSPMITPEWVNRYDYHWALNSEKAVKQLGYTITPLYDGIEKTIKWIRENR